MGARKYQLPASHDLSDADSDAENVVPRKVDVGQKRERASRRDAALNRGSEGVGGEGGLDNGLLMWQWSADKAKLPVAGLL